MPKLAKLCDNGRRWRQWTTTTSFTELLNTVTSKGKDIPRRAHRRLVSRLGAHNLLPARPDWRQNASRRPVLLM
ncbi:hypothetical protein TYRP_020856 [Tyrophagus putrescentiae]|nr:hypothetical protein TYRP_020856 [Tyrophagus putrescentiae]